jgi:hypothetical protein
MFGLQPPRHISTLPKPAVPGTSWLSPLHLNKPTLGGAAGRSVEGHFRTRALQKKVGGPVVYHQGSDDLPGAGKAETISAAAAFRSRKCSRIMCSIE